MTTGALDIDGIRWAYDDGGDGPLLLLFHGTLSGKAAFEGVLPVLRTRRRVVAFDWPGHGDSGYDLSGWTVQDLVATVPRLITGLGERTAAIGGVSQGGAISMRVALRSPDCVDALITMSAGPDSPGPEAVAMMAALGGQLADGTESERRTALENIQRKWFHAPNWVQEHPEAAGRELTMMLGHPREAMPSVTRIPTTYDSIEPQLGEISCPTLVIWGEHDVRAYWGPPMADQIPHAQLAIIPDAGHHVTLDATELVGAAIAAFLDDLDTVK